MRFATLLRAVRHPTEIGRGLQRMRARAELHREIKKLRGVIHVGANDGLERDYYAGYGLAVLWIEANPEMFPKLQTTIAGYPRQRALCYLATDRDGVEMTFHVANEHAGASSILEFTAEGREIWPTVQFVKDISVTGYTLDTILRRESLTASDYDGIVLDTQGSELLVLKGASATLRHIRFLQPEIHGGRRIYSPWRRPSRARPRGAAHESMA